MILVIDSVFLEKLLKHIIMYICLSLLPPNQNRWLRLCGGGPGLQRGSVQAVQPMGR
jgi:hypothetical protein